ncbi:hypothetical protein I6A84_01355 [Frankia sp. CNm7]|uniref:Uncharacterized protein n=1 Tax=Frankia nepalensis TaxID=1836974 RepID=A0A937RCL8_9ACTN|nr:hypothetical protein [Frankia nepalensis]MBL7498009.1 hypothetical protein [Frankia nepalensis]MBL7509091.1 hypothetical protein [Frankia nepalensis]MBL7516806.1 hypothetical protein [Frankia nepalensis]MBL7627802.1 hypothetical protein [Frankia nepalensis]
MAELARRTASEQDVDQDAHRAGPLSGTAPRDIDTTDDVASAAPFLVTGASRTTTGQSIIVDAGGVMPR